MRITVIFERVSPRSDSSLRQWLIDWIRDRYWFVSLTREYVLQGWKAKMGDLVNQNTDRRVPSTCLHIATQVYACLHCYRYGRLVLYIHTAEEVVRRTLSWEFPTLDMLYGMLMKIFCSSCLLFVHSEILLSAWKTFSFPRQNGDMY